MAARRVSFDVSYVLGKPAGRHRPGGKEPAMNHPTRVEHQAQRAEELISWTGRERLRMMWYRLRLTISEMNYAVQRLTDPRIRLP